MKTFQKGFVLIPLLIVLILAGAAGFGLTRKACYEISPLKPGQSDSRAVMKNGKLYWCDQTYFEKLAGPLFRKSIPRASTSPEPYEISNWETYRNEELQFSIQVPANTMYKEGGWSNASSTSSQKFKELSWTSNAKDYDIYVFVTPNATLRPRYGNEMPLTIENLRTMFIDDGPGGDIITEVNFSGRKAVKVEGYGAGADGIVVGTIDYYIIDGKREIRLYGTTKNIKEIPMTFIDKILSTFKFLR